VHGRTASAAFDANDPSRSSAVKFAVMHAYLERRSISGLVTTQRVKSIGLQVRFTPVNRHWQAF
jgi:hypothetical protein